MILVGQKSKNKVDGNNRSKLREELNVDGLMNLKIQKEIWDMV